MPADNLTADWLCNGSLMPADNLTADWLCNGSLMPADNLTDDWLCNGSLTLADNLTADWLCNGSLTLAHNLTVDLLCPAGEVPRGPGVPAAGRGTPLYRTHVAADTLHRRLGWRLAHAHRVMRSQPEGNAVDFSQRGLN